MEVFVKHKQLYTMHTFGRIDVPPALGVPFMRFLDMIENPKLFTFESINLKIFLNFEIGKKVMERIEKMNIDISKVFPHCGPTSELRFQLPFMNPFELLDDTTSNPFKILATKIKEVKSKIPKIVIRVSDDMSLNSKMCDLEIQDDVALTVKCIEFDTVHEFRTENEPMLEYLKKYFPNLQEILFTNIKIDLGFKHIDKHRLFLQNMLTCGKNIRKFGMTVYPQSPSLNSYEVEDSFVLFYSKEESTQILLRVKHMLLQVKKKAFYT
eukprot:CAMPEP_0168351382 /NCGR_PEP_ID=MMETSP0213-20121227/21827_1 /TAXON_ID=151035 /ORGANISM="Euplotes harpa, Strain FSP1.4" /LENGTH=266 /DNA_ID=CAMNT_0008362201 /DNA_START=219 /DNA_END=1015 /DNA_ORIENTATION=-